MTVWVAVLLVAILIVAVIVLIVRRDNAAFHDASNSDSDWLQRARRAAFAGEQLVTDLAPLVEGVLSDLTDDQLHEVVASTKHYGHEIASITATAPTPTDARVLRELGVHVREVRGLGENELVRRELGELDSVNASSAAAEKLASLRQSVDDLDLHLKLQ